MKDDGELQKVIEEIMQNHDKDMNNILSKNEFQINGRKHTELWSATFSSQIWITNLWVSLEN